MENVVKKDPKSLSDVLRVQLKGVLDTAAGFLLKMGLTPNSLTILGLVGHVLAAYLLARGWIFWGGVVLLLMAPADALDGSMARLQGGVQPFGAFLDSVTDRYAEMIVFGGLLLYYIPQGNLWASGWVYLAMMGSVMVSYSRARAESLGIAAKNGILTRLERYLVLIPSLLFQFPMVGAAIIAVLGNVTAFQRIWRVRQEGRHS